MFPKIDDVYHQRPLKKEATCMQMASFCGGDDQNQLGIQPSRISILLFDFPSRLLLRLLSV